MDPALARLVELRPDRGDPLGVGLARDVEDALALEVRAAVHAPVAAGELGVGVAQHLAKLVRRPDEELSLVALGIRVLRRIKPAGRVGHLAQDVVERLLADPPALRVAEGEPAVKVERRELAVVVEHLLEVRHEPVRVDGVAMKPAADLIVHAAAGHHRQRRVRHLARARVLRALPVAQHELPDHRLRELRRAAEAPVGVVELRRDRLERLAEDRGSEELGRGPQALGLAEGLADLARRLDDLSATRRPGVRERGEQARESGEPVPVDRRKIRAAVERRAVGRQEHGHRPPAVTGHRLDGLHVDLIDVRALLAVDLHVHEVPVHHFRDLWILERLVLHHVAPVTRGIADREEQRLVLGPGLREGFVAPRVPVHGIVGVLEQVRAGLAREAVFRHEGLRLPGERQRADARRDRAPAETNRHAGAGIGVLAPDERERDRPLEAERPGRARDPADRSVVGDHLGAVRRHLVAVQEETAQHPVHVAPVADPHDDLLAGVAAFCLGDEIGKRDLGKQHRLVDVVTEERRPRLDPERVEGREPDRPRAGADKRIPHSRRLARRACDPHLGFTRLPATAHEPHRGVAELTGRLRPLALRWTRARQALARLRRLRSGEYEERRLAGDVADRHLLGKQIMIERLGGLLRHGRRRHDQDPIVDDPDEKDDLHLAVDVEQGRRAPLSRPERFDLVAHESVQERRAIASGQLEQSEVATIEEPDTAAHERVLLGRVSVRDGQLPVCEALELRARGDVTLVERQPVRHGVILHDAPLPRAWRYAGACEPRARLRAVRPPPRRTIRRFQRHLLAWYAEHGRDLPWRRTRHPYRVLVSEIMLQQTQVDRVVPKYGEFLRHYPTLERLAAARVGDVRRLWYPLGYNVRPIRLHAIARETVARYAGRLPDREDALRQLPGVGRYTAGAILSFAYGQDTAVLDTNVRRVLGRVFLGPRRL